MGDSTWAHGNFWASNLTVNNWDGVWCQCGVQPLMWKKKKAGIFWLCELSCWPVFGTWGAIRWKWVRLKWRSGYYFYARAHSRWEYLESVVFSRLIEDYGCLCCVCGVAVFVLKDLVPCLSSFSTFCLCFGHIDYWTVLIFSWCNSLYGSNFYFSKVIFANQIIFL